MKKFKDKHGDEYLPVHYDLINNSELNPGEVRAMAVLRKLAFYTGEVIATYKTIAVESGLALSTLKSKGGIMERLRKKGYIKGCTRDGGCINVKMPAGWKSKDGRIQGPTLDLMSSAMPDITVGGGEQDQQTTTETQSMPAVLEGMSFVQPGMSGTPPGMPSVQQGMERIPPSDSNIESNIKEINKRRDEMNSEPSHPVSSLNILKGVKIPEKYSHLICKEALAAFEEDQGLLGRCKTYGAELLEMLRVGQYDVSLTDPIDDTVVNYAEKGEIWDIDVYLIYSIISRLFSGDDSGAQQHDPFTLFSTVLSAIKPYVASKIIRHGSMLAKEEGTSKLTLRALYAISDTLIEESVLTAREHGKEIIIYPPHTEQHEQYIHDSEVIKDAARLLNQYKVLDGRALNSKESRSGQNCPDISQLILDAEKDALTDIKVRLGYDPGFEEKYEDAVRSGKEIPEPRFDEQYPGYEHTVEECARTIICYLRKHASILSKEDLYCRNFSPDTLDPELFRRLYPEQTQPQTDPKLVAMLDELREWSDTWRGDIIRSAKEKCEPKYNNKDLSMNRDKIRAKYGM